MFHLSDKLVLGINKGFNLDRDFVLCAKENSDGRFPDLGKHKDLQECIDTIAGGDIESLFHSLYSSGESSKTGAALFVEHDEFAYIISIYLKSVLKDPSLVNCYVIYKLYLEGQQLSCFSASNTFAFYLDALKEFKPMSKDNFRIQWEKAEPARFFDLMPKKSMPINMLLAEHIMEDKSKYSPLFLAKYEQRRWEEWVEILKDTAGEILNASPALGRIFKGVKINENVPILQQLEQFPKTKWIIDYYNNDWDTEYCKNNFDSEFFTEIFNDIYGHYASKETGMNQIIELLNKPVGTAFRDDISSGFKSEFLMNSDDALYFSYIYRLKLEGRMDIIQNFRLRDGSI